MANPMGQQPTPSPLTRVGCAILVGWSAISVLVRLAEIDSRWLLNFFPGLRWFQFGPFDMPGELTWELNQSRVQWLSLLSLVTIGLLVTGILALVQKQSGIAKVAGILGAVHVFLPFLDFVFVDWYLSRADLFVGLLFPAVGTALLAVGVLQKPSAPSVAMGFPGAPAGAGYGVTPPAGASPFGASGPGAFTPGTEVSGFGGTPYFGGGADPVAGASMGSGGGVPMMGLDVNTPMYWLQAFGSGTTLVSISQLQQFARAGTIQSTTMVQHKDASFPVPVNSVPGVFSTKTYTTALLLSIFTGGLGIDRFYLGYTGIGVGKLLTLGGCGIWSLVDLILIATRKVPDSEGRPLA